MARVLYNFVLTASLGMLVSLAWPGMLHANETLAWQPQLQATSYGAKDATIVFLGWSLPDGVKEDESQIEDLGFELVRRDVGSLLTVNPGEEGYTDGTAGGWIEDESVEAYQTYTYDVRIFDREGRSSSASISIRAEPDVIYDPEEDCTKSPAVTATTDGQSVTLEWTPMCGADEYEVWRELAQEEEQGPFGAKASMTKVATALAHTTLTYTDTVENAGDYVYTVVGYQLLSGTPDEVAPTDSGAGDVDIPGLPPAARLFGVGAVFAQGNGQQQPPPPGTKPVGRAQVQVKVGQGGNPPPQPPAGGAGQCSPNQLIDPQKSIGQNLACIYNQSLEIILWIIILTLIVAGYIYITSGGNADRVKLAKELLSAALIGGILYFAIPLMMEALGLQ